MTPRFGQLLDAAHRACHPGRARWRLQPLGRGFWPFHHLLEAGRDSPYRDWFSLDPDVLGGDRGLNAYPAPVAGTGHEPGLGYRCVVGPPGAAQAPRRESATAEYLSRVAEHWLRFGIDGWRLDVPDEIRVPAFWRDVPRALSGRQPRCLLRRRDLGARAGVACGNRFDGLMNYPLGRGDPRLRRRRAPAR